MRARTMLSLLLSSALACSGSDPNPTEQRPQLATACTTPKPKIVASPAAITRAPNTAGSVKFIVSNPCTATLEDWALTTSRTGSVTSVGAPSIANISTLLPDQSVSVFVSYNVGSAGTGTVVLTAKSGTLSTFGYQGVTVSAATGVPFGPYDLFDGSGRVRAPPLGFNLVFDNVDPSNIIQLIDSARAHHIKFVPAMTDGGHDNYLTNGKFDYTKWKNRQQLFNTSAIRTAVNNAVADGTIIWAELMDEPNHPEGSPPVADWGGVMTHALLDSMSRYTKAIFPTLRTGVAVRWDWQQSSVYQSLDVIVSQYSVKEGDVNTYRNSGVIAAANQKVALMFSLNILDGGTKVAGCPVPQTGGLGTKTGSCRMTGAQVRTFGNALVGEPTACGLTMWTWDDAFMGKSENQSAFSDVAATAAAHSTKACAKPS